jgi:hypothetical protein
MDEMGSNIAVLRAAKAQRRKAVVAQKRREETIASNPMTQAARAANAPIRLCLLSEELFETGMGTLVLARGNLGGGATVAIFLLDTFCLGVKEVVFETMQPEQLRLYVDHMDAASRMVPVEPAYALKLLVDLVHWSRELGFDPPRLFAAAERLFGDVAAQACETVFEFGQNGKPLYVAGPNDSAAVSKLRMQRLQERLGEGAYDYLVPVA